MAEPSCPILGRHHKHLVAQDAEIEAADEVPDPDPRNLHTLIMSLSEETFHRVTQKFSETPNLTPNEMRNILLEEDRKHATVKKGPNVATEQSATQGQGDELADPRMPRCGACGKFGHGEDRCWQLHPELTPAWFQRQPLKQKKAKAKGREEGKKLKVCWLSQLVEEGLQSCKGAKQVARGSLGNVAWPAISNIIP